MVSKEAHAKWMREYRRTLRGFLDQKYTAMSQRVRGLNKNCVSTMKGLPIISREEFIEWSYNQPILHVLFEAYKQSNWTFKYCPTIDRIDSSKGYVFGNMQYLTQSQNSAKEKGRKRIQTGPSKRSSSGVQYVYWHKGHKRWFINKQGVYGGEFKTVEEAKEKLNKSLIK